MNLIPEVLCTPAELPRYRPVSGRRRWARRIFCRLCVRGRRVYAAAPRACAQVAAVGTSLQQRVVPVQVQVCGLWALLARTFLLISVGPPFCPRTFLSSATVVEWSPGKI